MVDAVSNRARLSLILGVVGHLEDRLPDDWGAHLREQISATLDALSNALDQSQRSRRPDAAAMYSESKPSLSLVTALASGADSLAAETALAGGHALDVVLPFPDADYRTDFSVTGAMTFDRLRAQARATMVLPSARQHDPADDARAYELAGRIILAQSDVLIAIWNGGPSGGRGGTRAMIDEAVRLRMPVIHIDATGCRRPALLWSGFEDFPMADWTIDDLVRHELPASNDDTGHDILARLVEHLAYPQPVSPPGHAATHDREAFRRFLASHAAAWNQPRTGAATRLAAQIAPFGPPTPTGREPMPGSAAPAARLLQSFAAADTTASLLSGRFRRAVLAIFACAAMALICPAIAKLHLPAGHGWLIAAELILLLMMIGITVRGRSSGLHRRWIDARDVAERLRLSLTFRTLGIWPWPTSLVGRHDDWIGFFIRSQIREQPVCDNTASLDWLSEARAVLRRLIEQQIAYHRHLREKMRRRSDWLGLASKLGLGAVTLALGLYLVLLSVAHLVPARTLEGFEHHLSIWTTVVSAMSFGAFGLKTTLDFDGVMERSAHSLERLVQHRDLLDVHCQTVTELHAFAGQVASMMLDDLQRWRLVAESRVLDMPG